MTAKVIAETRHSTALVTHLTHPRPVQWSSVFSAFSSSLDLPIVPYSEWLHRLEKRTSELVGSSAEVEAAAYSEIPALKLMDFFIGAAGGNKDAKHVVAVGLQLLSLDEAKKASLTMRDENLQQVGQKDVQKWLEYWSSTSFLRR